MWFILMLIILANLTPTQQKCNSEIDGTEINAITELFNKAANGDRWTLLFTEYKLITFWNVTYNEKQRILEVYNFTCNDIDLLINPTELKGLHTVVALESPDDRLFLAISSKNTLTYSIFKASIVTKFFYRYIKEKEELPKYKYIENEFNSLGLTVIKEIRAIANIHNQNTKYLTIYRRQENDVDNETGVSVLLHQNQSFKSVSSLHRRYSRECLVVAATGVRSESNNFYGIEIHDNKFVVRQFFVDNFKPNDCMSGVVIQGSISELLNEHPDPCKGSKMDEIIPFGRWKVVMFGRWMYRTQKGIRIRERQWEKMSWYYPSDANSVRYELNKIQFGTFVDAAFYRKKNEETFIFFMDEYFVMRSINDQGNGREKIVIRFNIDIKPNERLTAAFFNDKTDEAYLISGKKFWVVSMEQSNGQNIKWKSTLFLFGRERNVDAVDVDDQYFYFFDGDEHFTFEKNTLQDRVFRSRSSVKMKNRDNIFLCYTARDPFKSKLTKWIIAALLLLLFFAFLLTCFVFNYPGKTSSSLDSLQRSKSANQLSVLASMSNTTKLRKNIKRKS